MLSDYAKATGVRISYSFAIALIAPVLAPFLKDLGFDYIQLSIIFSLFPIVVMFSSMPLGKLADDIGRMKVVKIGVIVQILSIILYAFGDNLAFISVARILHAFASIAFSLATLAKIQDSVHQKYRGKFTGISLSLAYIGRLAGPIIGGVLADKFFVEFPFFASIVLLCLLLLVIPKDRKRKKEKKKFSYLKQTKKFLSHRSLQGMAILGIVMHADQPAITLFLPLLIVENMGLSYSSVGVALFVMGLMHAFQFIFGSWSDKKAYRIVLIGCVISGIFMSLVSIATTYYILLLVLFLRGIGNGMWNVSAWTLMSNVGEKEKVEGEIIGSYMSIAKIGSIVSFLVSGFIATFYGIYTLFMLNGIIILLGTAVAYPLMKK